MTNKVCIVLFASIVLAWAQPAAAANLVTNGDFSNSTNFFGWTQGGAGNGLENFTSLTFPEAGPAAGFGSTNGSDNTLFQIVPTISGTSYDFSFTVSSGEAPNDFSASLNGLMVYSFVNQTPTNSVINDSFVATGPTTVQFAGADVPSFVYLQNVSVATPAVSATPLPASLPLFGAALFVIGGAGWLKRKKANA